MRRRHGYLVALIAVAAFVVPSAASGSVLVAENARKPALKVGANGDAEVSWANKKGQRQRLLVPFKGRVLPGEAIEGKNVARKNKRWKLPFKPILRKAPNGFFYALQTWRPRPGGPTELRLARWKSAPTQLTLTADFNGTKESLAGKATFRGKPVFGTSPTPAGLKKQLQVLLDCRECPDANGKGWARIAGRPLKSKDGAFSVNVRPIFEGSSYRAQLVGANRGRHLGPDAQVRTESARPVAVEAPQS